MTIKAEKTLSWGTPRCELSSIIAPFRPIFAPQSLRKLKIPVKFPQFSLNIYTFACSHIMTTAKKILAVSRAERFSPNSVDKDAAILQGVCDELSRLGHTVVIVSEETLSDAPVADVTISMARSNEALETLRRHEAEGRLTVNSTAGVVLACNRRKQTEVFRKGDIPVPAEEGSCGVWLKRAAGTAETAIDVQFAANDEERKTVERRMRDAGIADIIRSAHIEGDLVKFYGVRGTGFFRTYYPADDGDWKFDDEKRNGCAHHYVYDRDMLHSTADKAAGLCGLTVYGGDCIIDAKGKIHIIDFNDWPSFSRCREEAARAIAGAVCVKLKIDN